eukprot:2175055-Prymnesium_polylepis.1
MVARSRNCRRAKGRASEPTTGLHAAAASVVSSQHSRHTCSSFSSVVCGEAVLRCSVNRRAHLPLSSAWMRIAASRSSIMPPRRRRRILDERVGQARRCMVA